METTVISQTQTTLHTAYVHKLENLLFAKELHELRDNMVFSTRATCNCSRKCRAIIAVEPATQTVDALVILCPNCFKRQKMYKDHVK